MTDFEFTEVERAILDGTRLPSEQSDDTLAELGLVETAAGLEYLPPRVSVNDAAPARGAVRVWFNDTTSRNAVKAILDSVDDRPRHGQLKVVDDEFSKTWYVFLPEGTSPPREGCEWKYRHASVHAPRTNIAVTPLSNRQWDVLRLALDGVADDTHTPTTLATRGHCRRRAGSGIDSSQTGGDIAGWPVKGWQVHTSTATSQGRGGRSTASVRWRTRR
jgi:hypothetical protein